MKTIIIKIICLLLPIFFLFLLYSCGFFPLSEFGYFAFKLENEEKITPSDGVPYDHFGYCASISADGEIFIVGAPYDDDNGDESGSVYIYKWNGSSWDETKITASDGDSGDNFGNSVYISADGNSIAVGAIYDEDNGSESGSVYIYRWNETAWDETKITASDGAYGDKFGNCVSISADGNSILVGSPEDDDNSSGSGSVYVYKWNESSWDETKITAFDGDSGDSFGTSVSVSADGNNIVVGSPEDNDNGNDSGSVYVYKWDESSWDETKITASNGSFNDYFGISVSCSVDGNKIAVIAADSHHSSSTDVVYLYTLNGTSWDEERIIVSNLDSSNANFGCSISISADGNNIIVGASSDDDDSKNFYASGSVFVLDLNCNIWKDFKITPSDGYSEDAFGTSVSLSAESNSFIVGTPYDDDNGNDSGSVYVYK